MTEILEPQIACGPVAPSRLRLSREDRTVLSIMLETRQEGLDALESLARAVGTCTDSMPREGMVEARHLDVPLTLAIEAFRARQVETQAILNGNMLVATP